MSRPGRKRARVQADVSMEESVDDSNMADDDGDDGGDDDEGQQSHWELPAGYDDRNRAFLQAFMAHGVLTLKQAQFLLASILNVERMRKRRNEDDENGAAEEDEEAPLRPDEILIDDLREFVGKAQQALAPLDLDIRSAIDQTRNERLWALVSTDHDAKSHLAVLLTPRKLAFVNRLLVAIFDTYNTPRIEALCLTEQQALKLSRPPRSRQSDVGDAGSASQAANRDKGLKHSVVLLLLKSLVRQGWFEKSAAGFYTPTTRALLELEPALLEAFNDGSGNSNSNNNAWQRIKYCAACKDILTTGLRCTTLTCTLRLHDRCETAFWRTQATAAGGNRTCPHCQAAWKHVGEGEEGEVAAQHFVGERAITLTDVYRRKKRQGRPSEGVDELMRAVLPRTIAPVHIPLVGGRAAGGDADMAEEDDEEEGEGGEEEDADADADADADDTGM